MKVLRVIPSMDPQRGGPCQGIRNSIPELLKLDVYSEVVCLDNPSSDYLGKDSFTIHPLGNSKGPWAYNQELENWLGKNIIRFDVIIIHGLWLYHSYATMKIIKNLKVLSGTKVPKVYVMPHGMLDPWFQRADGRKLKAIRNWIYWRLIEKNVVNKADGLLFTSSEELRLARETFPGYRPKRELNVGYGITAPPTLTPDMAESIINIIPTLIGQSYLLFLSRIDVKKGVDLLVNVYLRLKKEGVKLPKLVIAGPGLDSPFGKKVQNMAIDDPDIIFPGMLSGQAKWSAFYGCEAFILPSHQENFGISVVESLACGKPVLISNQINIWNEIKAGGGGLVETDNEEGIRQLLLNWISLNVDERKVMAENAEKVYLKNYEIGGAAKKLKSSLQ